MTDNNLLGPKSILLVKKPLFSKFKREDFKSTNCKALTRTISFVVVVFKQLETFLPIIEEENKKIDNQEKEHLDIENTEGASKVIEMVQETFVVKLESRKLSHLLIISFNKPYRTLKWEYLL